MMMNPLNSPQLGAPAPTGTLDRLTGLNERLAEIERALNPPRRHHSNGSSSNSSRHTNFSPQSLTSSFPAPSIPQPAPPPGVTFHPWGGGPPAQVHPGMAPLGLPPLPAQNPAWMGGHPVPQATYSYPPQLNNNPQQQGPQQQRQYTTQPMQAPPTLYPPPPPYADETFKDFSQCPPQEYFHHETRLYQRINFHAKIRLGYGKAISVLQRELEQAAHYEGVIRPYQIDQPTNLPDLSPLIPNSEARLFADTVRALVDIIGLQTAVHVLENAKVSDVPGICYKIQRVQIPAPPARPEPVQSQAPPIPLEPEIPPDQPKFTPAEVGPFARSRASSVTSLSSAPSTYSWSPTSETSGTIASEDFDYPTPMPPPPPTRGILRRTASVPSLNGKRVTISTHNATSRYGFEETIRSMSPVPMSPIKLEDVPPLPELSRFNSVKPEEGVLQQMAAAQM
jgi:hypothetical protein